MGIINWSGRLGELQGAKDVQQIIDVLDICDMHIYSDVIRSYDFKDGYEAHLAIETELDELYYRELISLSRSVEDGGKLTGILGTVIDLRILKIILRKLIGRIPYWNG